MSKNDVILQGIKVYIEGVQVPFTSISITSGIGILPTAVVSIPVQAGLMEIAHNYAPKIHIFFSDLTKISAEEKENDRLLFSGLITQVSYYKSIQSGSVSITFQCAHRYHLIDEFLIDYTGWLTGNPMDTNPKEATKADNANSTAAIIEALQGVTGVSDSTLAPKDQVVSEFNSTGLTTLIPPEFGKFATRYIGIPGIILNYWNQLKRASFNSGLQGAKGKYENEAFVKMYQPLLEKGLRFFDRIAGHYPVEFAVDNARQFSCPSDPKRNKKLLIPPCNHNFLMSAVQAELTVSALGSMLQNSGELTTVLSIFQHIFESIDYDLLVLTSPAEAIIPPSLNGEDTEATNAEATQNITGTSEKSAVDVIVKPRAPFYFSPTCNVLFPGMYISINVTYDEFNIPTRVDITNPGLTGVGGYDLHIRAPHSVREAIAKKKAFYTDDQSLNLASTMASSGGAIGIYEQGRGVKMEVMNFPRWLQVYSQSTLMNSATDAYPDQDANPMEYASIQALSKGWEKRHVAVSGNPAVANMNPYSKDASGINALQRLLFSTADYYYTSVFARSKAGYVECLFNPYITPGYPMDILEKNPLYPSFHAHCMSVTHNITAESCLTTVGFTAAITYSELANYYIPFMAPFLQVTLGLAENPTLTNPDAKAYDSAKTYYRYTLGTTAIAPTDLMDFNTGMINPIMWGEGGDWVKGVPAPIRTATGGELNPMLSYEGNLSLVYREIENRAKIEERFNLKFIDMIPSNYTPSVMKYTDAALTDETKFELGQSQFLDYRFYFDDYIASERKQTAVEATNPTQAAISRGRATIDNAANLSEVVSLANRYPKK